MMDEIDLSSVPRAAASLWRLIAGALQLNPEAFRAAVHESGGFWLALITVFFAGTSSMLGHSVVLLLNRVSRRRFVVSLVAGALTLALGIGFWAASAWPIALLVSDARPRLVDVLTLVWLSHAPLLFGVLVLLPYLGSTIDKLLRVWVLVTLLVALHAVYELSFWTALLCAALGWLMSQVLSSVRVLTLVGRIGTPHSVLMPRSAPAAPHPPRPGEKLITRDQE
jgi:hypothetical protein